MPTPYPRQQVQPPLMPELENELVLMKAREWFERSRYLQRRYASFQRLIDDPVVGRSLLLGARQCLRRAKRKK